jgi:hypothetical protein
MQIGRIFFQGGVRVQKIIKKIWTVFSFVEKSAFWSEKSFQETNKEICHSLKSLKPFNSGYVGRCCSWQLFGHKADIQKLFPTLLKDYTKMVYIIRARS